MNRPGGAARWGMSAWMRGSTLEYPQQGVQPSWTPFCAIRLNEFVRATSIPEHGHALLRPST